MQYSYFAFSENEYIGLNITYFFKASIRKIILGQFTTDHLEKEFGKLRMGCGGTYFISCQQIIEKTSIQHGKLLLRLGEELDMVSGHCCNKCSRVLNDEECSIFSDLSDPENVATIEKEQLDTDCIQKLVYIAGYLCKNYIMEENDESTFDYYLKYGDYLDEINRGGLKKPDDTMVQFVILSYFLFLNVDKTEICRTSLSGYFMNLSKIHSLQILKPQSYSLSNIFFNNYCKDETPRSCKEIGQKALKLSKSS